MGVTPLGYLATVLRIHTASSLVPLASRLASRLVTAPADPMTEEWIASPSAGMQRWLSLELARHLGASSPGAGDGVAANIQHGFPGALRGAVLAAGRSADDIDPWAVERLTWAVLEELVADEVAPALGLVSAGHGASHYGRARRIADLFDRYHVHRPAMIREWGEGAGPQIALHQQWQPRLWRAVRARIGSPSPAEQMPHLLAEVAAGRLPLALPERVSVFGVSVLPGGSGFLELAAAVAATREVDLYLLEPSPALARTIRSTLGGQRPSGPRLRSTEPGAERVDHPLLSSWARLPREASVLVADLDGDGYELHTGEIPTDSSGTLLACLQHDLTANQAPSANFEFNASDRSIQMHVAHGATRQVEVLRDAILHLLANDASLTEDDIVVVCPDLDRFAPLLEAGFGQPASAPRSTDAIPASAEAGHAPFLRWRLSDRSLHNASPLVAATATLLDVVAGRFDAVSVLDAVALPAVRERYRFSEDDLGRFGDWVGEANIRWGLDPEHRGAFGVPAAVSANTWRAGLHRLLLGAAVMADEPGFALGGVVPVSVGEDDMDRVGRLADLIGRLDQLVQFTRSVGGEDSKRPLPEWIDAVRELVAGTLAPARDDAWQADALEQVFATVLGDATVAGQPTEALITFTDLRRLLSAHLVGGAGRGDFFRGGITVTSLDPMRWIPHRVVAVLGVDQSAFASSATDGDDLAALTPVVGDRDPRAEGRQAVLEAVLAAGEYLVLTRDGHDLTTNQEIPPAVIVAELRDALMATVTPQTNALFTDAFETRHPRQPYDVRCLQPGELGTVGPWAFDPGALAGAKARREKPGSASPFLAAPLAPPSDADVLTIDLAELHRVIADAGAAFLSRRLGLRLPNPGESPSVSLPVELGGLDGYAVGDRLLRARLDGADPAAIADLERAAGSLPSGVLGHRALADVSTTVEAIVAKATVAGVRPGPPDMRSVAVDLGQEGRVVGIVPVSLDGEYPGPARLGYASMKPKYHLGAWLDLMVLTAADPSVTWSSLVIHRVTTKDPAKVVHLMAAGADAAERRANAMEALLMVVDLWRRNRCEPLPLFESITETLYQEKSVTNGWNNTMGFGDGDKPASVLIYGDISAPDLLDLPARADDPDVPGDPVQTPGRAARYARLLWTMVERTSVPFEDERAQA